MFKKAQREAVKLKLALTGPAGAGKTFSALRLAKGLGGKIAVIDTENGSASLYAEQFDFDVMVLSPPFTAIKYIEAIKAAEKAAYSVLIIDSISHAWLEITEKKSQSDLRPGVNSFTSWGIYTPIQNSYISAILQSSLNVICTIRSKTDYVMQTNEKGKMAPQKVGLAPVQRDGVEYEFTTIFDINIHHEASLSKDRTGLFIDKIFTVTEETGLTIKSWLESAPVQEVSAPQPTENVIPISGAVLPPPLFKGAVKDLVAKYAQVFGVKAEERNTLNIIYGNVVSENPAPEALEDEVKKTFELYFPPK